VLGGGARNPRPLIGADPQPVDAKALDNRTGRFASGHQKTANAPLAKPNRKRAEDLLGERRSAFPTVFRLRGGNLLGRSRGGDRDRARVEPLRGPAEGLDEDLSDAFD
jgi:hypothetical protein